MRHTLKTVTHFSNKPILAIVHVYYPQLWQELKNCLNNITVPYDLYVTTVEANKDIELDVMAFKDNARFEVVDNRGYDLGPFIHVINKVKLDDYSYIVKLHTKRGFDIDSNYPFRSLDRDKWKKKCLSFIETVDNFSKSLNAFSKNPKLGIINDISTIVKYDIYTKLNKIKADKWIKEHGLPVIPFRFIGGTMFIARACIFKGIQDLKLSISDFPVPDKEHSFQLAHIVEKLFGYFAYRDGYTVEDPNLSPLIQELMLMYYYIHDSYIGRKIKRSIFLCNLNKKGNVRIQIFRIPLPDSIASKIATWLFKY